MRKPLALVVGGTKGLGLAVSRALARDGNDVVALARNPSTALDAVAGAAWVPADLRDRTALRDALERVVAERGPIQHVVLSQRYRASDDPWEGELAVTLTASHDIVEFAKDHFAADGDKSIVAVSSVFGSFVGDGQPAAYHVAKAGLAQLIRYYALTLGTRGVRANTVSPCTFLKDETRHFVEQNQPLMALYREFVPLGRVGTAADTAEVIAFLCSPRAAYVTGQELVVDGGLGGVWPEGLLRRQAKI